MILIVIFYVFIMIGFIISELGSIYFDFTLTFCGMQGRLRHSRPRVFTARCRHCKLARHVPSFNKVEHHGYSSARRIWEDSTVVRFWNSASILTRIVLSIPIRACTARSVCLRLNKLISSHVSHFRFSALCATRTRKYVDM